MKCRYRASSHFVILRLDAQVCSGGGYFWTLECCCSSVRIWFWQNTSITQPPIHPCVQYFSMSPPKYMIKQHLRWIKKDGYFFPHRNTLQLEGRCVKPSKIVIPVCLSSHIALPNNSKHECFCGFHTLNYQWKKCIIALDIKFRCLKRWNVTSVTCKSFSTESVSYSLPACTHSDYKMA